VGAIYSFLAGANQHLLAYAESDEWSRRSIAFGERKEFPHAIANGYEFLAENAGGRGHWNDALAYAERDREFGAKSGSLARVAWSGFPSVMSLHGKGELAAALKAAHAGLQLCEQIGEGRLATWFEPMAAITLADLGDDDAAREHADRGRARAQELDQLLLSAWALHGAGHAAMQRDDVSDALKWYEQYVALVRETENGVARIFVLGYAAEAFFRAGRVDDAVALADQALAVAEFAKAPHFLALALRVRGQIFAAQERHDEALHAFEGAIAALMKNGSRLELARAMYHRASLQLVRGDASAKTAARADGERARDAFAEMGAVHDRALAERLLAQVSGDDR